MNITVRLIRDKGIQEGLHLSVEELLTLQVVRLEGLNITKIDNLEPFDDLQEIYLKNNRIKIIENLEFLIKLRVLDLSFNLIRSENFDAWAIPASVVCLNLSGNPCADDDVLLSKLIQTHPGINIITNDIEEPPADNINENCSTPTTSNENQPLTGVEENLDSESVLHDIVARKCLLQNIERYDFSATIKALNQESDDAIKDVQNRCRRGRGGKGSQTPDMTPYTDSSNSLSDDHASDTNIDTSADKRLQAIVNRNRENAVENERFFKQLRDNAIMLLNTKFIHDDELNTSNLTR
eukprot:gene1559-3014_t